MRIGISLLSLNRATGGSYQYAITFTRHLTRYDLNSEYFIFYGEDDILKEGLQGPNVSMIFIRDDKQRIRQRVPRLLLGWLIAQTQLDVGFLRGRYAMIRRLNLDLLIQPAHGISAIMSGVPYIITIHDSPYQFNREARKAQSVRYLIWNSLHVRVLTSRAEGVIVDSENGKLAMLKGYDVPEYKIHILPFRPPDYIDPDIYTSRLDVIKQKYELPDSYLFFPSAFHSHKNHSGLLAALEIVRRQYELTVPLVLVGARESGDSFDQVMNRIRELNMTDQVRYLGYVPDEDMTPLYKLAGSLVFPTSVGPTSIPIVEAFAAGCPVICSNVEGYGDQVGDAGLLVDPTSPNDLAQAICSVYTDSNLREGLIEKGRARLSRIAPDDYGKRIFQIVQSVLDNG